MTFLCITSWVFTFTYCLYWFLSMIHSQDSVFNFGDQLNQLDNILSLIYLCYNFITIIIIAGYVVYLKLRYNMNKIEIKNMVLKKNQKKIVGHIILNILYAIAILILILEQNKFHQSNFLKIHTFILCIVQYIQFYNISKVYGYLQNRKIQIVYFIILGIFLSIVVFFDGYYSNSRGYKHQISGNIILLIELIYLEFILSSEKIILSIILKTIQYGYNIRYYMLFTGAFNHFLKKNKQNSIDFVLMLFIFVLICLIVIKDLVLAYIKINQIYIQYKQKSQRLRIKQRILQHFRRKKNQNINLSQIQIQQGNIQNCTICLDNNNKQQFIKLGCQHGFHMQCISQWFSYTQQCPLCRIQIQLI